MRPIVTLTLNPAIDASCQADEVGPVRKIRTFDERYDPGGGGINVARVAGRRRGDGCPRRPPGQGKVGQVIADQADLGRACRQPLSLGRDRGLQTAAFPIGDVVAGERNRVLALGQLQLKDHVPHAAKRQFRADQIEFPHSTETFVV
jgi:hypothetical protein